MDESVGQNRRGTHVVAALVCLVAIGLVVFVPSARWFVGTCLALAGPATIYGGLVAFLRGSLGVQSASRLVGGLACGTVTPILLILGLIVDATPGTVLTGLGLTTSLLAIFFAVAAFSGEREPPGRFVAPIEEQ